METKQVRATEQQLNNVITAAAPIILEETLGFLAAKYGMSKDEIVAALQAGHVGLLEQFEVLNNAAAEVIIGLMNAQSV